MSACYCEKYPVFVCQDCLQKNEVYELKQKLEIAIDMLNGAAVSMEWIGSNPQDKDVKDYALVSAKVLRETIEELGFNDDNP